jgi:hypothetical protein
MALYLVDRLPARKTPPPQGTSTAQVGVCDYRLVVTASMCAFPWGRPRQIADYRDAAQVSAATRRAAVLRVPGCMTPLDWIRATSSRFLAAVTLPGSV